MALTAREAGERVGRTRQAIIKAIKKGTISAEKDAAGEWRIEPVELFRVYLPATVDDNQPATESASYTAGLQREVAMLRERIAELAEERDRWRDQAERAMRLLTTDQRPPAVRHGWWKRVFGH